MVYGSRKSQLPPGLPPARRLTLSFYGDSDSSPNVRIRGNMTLKNQGTRITARFRIVKTKVSAECVNIVVVALCCPFVGVLHKEQSLGSEEVLFVTQQRSSGQVVITGLLKKSFVCTESTLLLTSSLLWSSCLHYDSKM